MTTEQFRRLALSMPGAVEGAHHDHPDFRANGRIFATLHPDGERGMVKLSPSQQRDILQAHAGDFAPANGAWGRAGCTYVRLSTVATKTLLDALTLAWQESEARPGKRTHAKPRKTHATKRRPRRKRP